MDTITTSNPNLFNTAAIKQFTGLDDTMVAMLVTTFFEELTASNEQLKGRLETGDMSGIRQIIHTMRPGFVMFGIDEAASIMGDILDRSYEEQPEEFLANANRYYEVATGLHTEIDLYLRSR